MVTGIICEYNPLHSGHKKQLDYIRAADPDGTIVCLMSGNYVQRGKPAIFNKTVRAKAAILSGADLVLELPVTYALSSAEGFAAGGIAILDQICDQLCFGAETADPQKLTFIAQTLLSKNFSQALSIQLEKGLSFPAARQAALEGMGMDAELLSTPNNILATEYCKAIITQNSKLKPLPILRQGDYHDLTPDMENPSASAVRNLIINNEHWDTYVPKQAVHCFKGAGVHTIHNAECAILARLRTMTDSEFEALPYGSEGLWRKLMHASRKEASLESILTSVKSKRYTRTRLDRMVMCAYLAITSDILQSPAPYTRILAFNDRGRKILNSARDSETFINVGQAVDHPYQQLETRTGQLYGLFANVPEPANQEDLYRVYYHNEG